MSFAVNQSYTNGSSRPQQVSSILELDFRKGFCPDDFQMMSTDGCVTSDNDGLTINSSTFKSSQSQGALGFLDYYKWCATYKACIPVDRSKETIVEAKMSNKQIFSKTPVPSEFSRAISDIFADPRLAHGQVSVIDPESGIIAGFVLTDHQLYALYGRMPALCNVLNYKSGNETECEPCVSCTVTYGCQDFWQDCRYIDFKQNTKEPEWKVFSEFCVWCDFCRSNSSKVNNWKVFTQWRRNTGFNCGNLNRVDYVSWKSNYSWSEYCNFLEGWADWYRQYREWEACSDAIAGPASCKTGECGRLYGPNISVLDGKPCNSCYHVYTPDGQSCYTGASVRVENGSYVFDTNRSCVSSQVATFIEMVPVLRTEASDPLCDMIKVAIGIDRKYKTLKYYVNNQTVFKVVDIGRRLNDAYRVVEMGGYADTVDFRTAVISFGTGSMLDASLPNNYNRYDTSNNWKDKTALVPLLPVEMYRNIYFNKIGELIPKSADQFVVGNEVKYRQFLQGDVMKLQYIVVLVRPASRDYTSLRSYCAFSSCCGGRVGPDCRLSCDDDLCDCCNSQYGPCGMDERDFQIEFVQSGTKGVVVGDDLVYNPNVQCPNEVQARLVRVPQSKRYWQSNCGDPTFGTNPYL